MGSDLKCPRGDHSYEDNAAGWGFCYPGTWKYNLHTQSTASPPELDIVLDITDVPCTTPTAPPGQTPRPSCAPNAGLFGLMVVSTFERGSASTLADWLQTPVASAARLRGGESISWGNAKEALHMPDGRRIALTATHVVILELRSGAGNLDLEGAMGSRLGTWKFFT